MDRLERGTEAMTRDEIVEGVVAAMREANGHDPYPCFYKLAQAAIDKLQPVASVRENDDLRTLAVRIRNRIDPGQHRLTAQEADDIIHDELRVAVEAEREACATVALEQRCERGTPWDKACTTIAAAIRARKP